MWRHRHRDFQGTRCLVTGASSGLGRAIAEGLARAGAAVILTGRSEPRLLEVIDGLIKAGFDPEQLDVVSADLTREEDRARVFQRVDDRFGGALDILVNSAGVGATGHFETHEPWVLRAVFEINFFALAEMCRLGLDRLRRGRKASLVNVGSINGRRGLPGRPEYSASKFAVSGLTEALRSEWVKHDIHVMLLNPGYTETAFAQNALVDNAKVSVARLRRMQTADQVASAMLRGLRRGANERVLSPIGRALLLVNRIFPRFVDWGLDRWTLQLYRDLNAFSDRQGLANGQANGHKHDGSNPSTEPDAPQIRSKAKRPRSDRSPESTNEPCQPPS